MNIPDTCLADKVPLAREVSLKNIEPLTYLGTVTQVMKSFPPQGLQAIPLLPSRFCIICIS